MPKKKSGPKAPTLPKDKVEKLKELFLESGMTPYQAGRIVKCHHDTAKKFFEMFAEELCHEENHEDWFAREKRVRQRALEGYSTNIKNIRDDIKKYRKILEAKFKENDDAGIEQYERIIRNQTVILIDLTDRFDALEMAPPTEVLLDKEIEMRIAMKNGMRPDHEQS